MITERPAWYWASDYIPLEVTLSSMTLRVLNLVQLRNWRLPGSSLKRSLQKLSWRISCMQFGIVTTVPHSYVSRSTFRICPSFSFMTSLTFYDLLPLTHAYNIHMLTISHAYDFHMLTIFTCFSFTYLYDYLVLYKPPCNIFDGSLVFIVNLSCYRLSPLDGLIDNFFLYFFCH